MIFDFERCIYEPTAWQLLAYYNGGHKTKKQYEKELEETKAKNPDYKPPFNVMKKALCNQYAILEMKMVNETVSIYLFDEDIEKLIIAIRASHKRGDNYVFANIKSFEDVTLPLNFVADVNTFGQN